MTHDRAVRSQLGAAPVAAACALWIASAIFPGLGFAQTDPSYTPPQAAETIAPPAGSRADRLAQARQFMASGETVRAEQLFAAIAAATAPPDPPDAEALIGQSAALAAMGRDADAIVVLDAVRTTDPNLLLDQAALLTALGRATRAVSLIDDATRLGVNPGRMRMARGEAFYAMQGYRAAHDEFLLAAKEHMPQAARAAGDALLAQNKLEGASSAYDWALKINSGDVAARRSRADVRQRLGEARGALEDYDILLSAESADADAFMARSNIRRSLGDVTGAAADLRQAATLRRDDEALLRLAALEVDAGRLEAAERTLQTLITPQPYRARILMQLGRIAHLRGRQDAARSRFTEALELRPGAPELLYNRALTSLAANDPDAARRDLEDAHSRAPNDSQIRDAIGRLMLSNGQEIEAAAYYDAAVQARGDNDDAAWAQRAAAQLARGAPAEALSDAERALGLNPDNADALLRAAQAAQALGRPPTALDYARRLRGQGASEGRAALLEAEALLAMGETPEALVALESARGRPGVNPAEFAMLQGDAQMTRHDPAAALVFYDQAVAASQSGPLYLARRARSLAALGRDDDAATALSLALEQTPNDLALLLRRAEVYGDMGRCSDAIADYNVVLQFDPGRSHAQKQRGLCRIRAGSVLSGVGDLFNSWF